MEPFFETLVFAFVFIVLALALLGIGWLITGKQKMKRGMCGKNPDAEKDESCVNSCPTCGKKPEEKEDE